MDVIDSEFAQNTCFFFYSISGWTLCHRQGKATDQCPTVTVDNLVQILDCGVWIGDLPFQFV